MMARKHRTVNTGRNLPVATAVGLLLLGTIVASLAYNPEVFAYLTAAIGVLAARELMSFNSALVLPQRLITIAVAAIILVGYFEGPARAALFFVAASIAVALNLLRTGVEGYAHKLSMSVFVLFYIGLLLSFAVALADSTNALGRVMTLVLLTAANDTGGYFAGILFGKHPLVPTISPKKSWEGLVGSLALAGVFGAFAIPHLIDITATQGAILGLIMALSATAGDLIESAIKRDAGIKDSGNTIPGHGGVLDRIDAQLTNAPIAWVAITMIFGV